VALSSLKRKEKRGNDRFSVKFSKDNESTSLYSVLKDINVSYGASVPASRASTLTLRNHSEVILHGV
jgi:hypothetical protein